MKTQKEPKEKENKTGDKMILKRKHLMKSLKII